MRKRQRQDALKGRGPERRVLSTGVSPMNARVRWVELSCGHTVFVLRRPRRGTLVRCERCQEPES